MVPFCDKKLFWWKIVIPAPSLIAYFFRDQNFSDRQKGSSTNFFSTLKQEFLKKKSWYSLPLLRPLLFTKLLDTRHFVRQRRVPLIDESVLWHKILLTENCDIRPLSDVWRFSTPKIFWNTVGSSARWISNVTKNNLGPKTWHPPPLLSQTFVDTRHFVRQIRVHYEVFLYCETSSFP